MKKILSLILIAMLVLSVFALAACGSDKAKEDMTSVSDEISTDLSALDDKLTENGNVTDSSSSEASTDESEVTTDESVLTTDGTTELVPAE